MPRVAITAAQKADQKRRDNFANKSKMLADGLRDYRAEKELTMEQFSEEIGIGRNTLSKLIRKNQEIRVSVETMWILFEKAGIRMTREVQGEA